MGLDQQVDIPSPGVVVQPRAEPPDAGPFAGHGQDDGTNLIDLIWG